MRSARALTVLLIAMLMPSWSSGQSPQAPARQDQGGQMAEPPLSPRAGKPGRADPSARTIKTITIKWKRTARLAQAQPPTAEELQSLTWTAGVDLTAFKDHGYGRVVFQLPRRMSRSEAEEIAAKIRALPDVEAAEPDSAVFIDTGPNDPLFVLTYGNRK
jgi:hypothetical protein